MIINLYLNEDHLNLVKFLRIDNSQDNKIVINKDIMLVMQNHLLDDTAMAIGLYDKRIKGTEDNEYGAAYPDDVEKRLRDTYNYVSQNLYYIETLLHQYVTEGIKPGHYKCKDNELIWAYVDDSQEKSENACK